MKNNSLAAIVAQSVLNGLFSHLLQQLNKDFSGVIDSAFPQTIAPEQLEVLLHKHLLHLVKYDSEALQNLLYAVDVPEAKILNISMQAVDCYAEEVSLLVLQREWEKVWYRNRG